MEVLQEIHDEFEKVSGKEEDEQSEMFEGKLKKVQKLIHFVQNTQFSRLNQVMCKSPRPAAKKLERKLLKNFLSVFRE